MKMNRK